MIKLLFSGTFIRKRAVNSFNRTTVVPKMVVKRVQPYSYLFLEKSAISATDTQFSGRHAWFWSYILIRRRVSGECHVKRRELTHS